MHGRLLARQATEQQAELMRRSLIHCTQQLDREEPPANDPTEPNFREGSKALTFSSPTQVHLSECTTEQGRNRTDKKGHSQVDNWEPGLNLKKKKSQSASSICELLSSQSKKS